MSETVSPIPGACPYEPPESLWSLVEKSTPEHEREEIKQMLGESLVEQSLELHDEVNLLLGIWCDYRDETEDLMSRSVQRLPEPPAARDRLKQEIRFFVESIREKAKDAGRDVTAGIPGINTNIVQYAVDERCASSGYGSRPSTARSSHNGRATPMIGAQDRCRSSLFSTLSDEVEAINDKFTYLQFDQVVAHLRETLESEVLQLRQDTDFLQKCLDDEVNFRSQSREGVREPSLAELSVERSRLEKELLKPNSPVPSLRDSSKLKTIPNSIISPTAASGANPRPAPPSAPKPGAAKSGNRTPVKACHNSPVTGETHRTRTTSGASKVSRVAAASPGSSSVGPTSSPPSSAVRRTTPQHAGADSSGKRVPSAGHSGADRKRVSSGGGACSRRDNPATEGGGGEVGATHNGPISDETGMGDNMYRMPDVLPHVTIRTAHMRTPPLATTVGAKAAATAHALDMNHNVQEEGGESSRAADAAAAESAKPTRPSSANRFRRMVQQCRGEE